MASRKDRTITRADLGEAVTRVTGLPRSDSAALVSQMLDLISEDLVRHEPVLLSGFGKFTVVKRAARRARNVRAGHEVLVEPRFALVFKPATGLVQALSEQAKASAEPSVAVPSPKRASA